MDILIKTYFDKYRNVGQLPPEIDGSVDVKLFPDVEVLNKWRNWRTGLNYIDSDTGATLGGALDDLGIKDGLYVPLDYKTRGFDVKPGGESYYKNQLNCYGLLLRKNDLPPADHAYLIYYIPKEISEKGMVRFDIVPKKVPIDPDEALKTFQEAVELIKSPAPSKHTECEYCSWGSGLLLED
ncbi:MAG: PD-(D/E)XK nuclease family protein [bacterium]|nr:PD-(D/E)XK nuclease family protein [bacterium]